MVTLTDAKGKEIEGYFCPFAGKGCYEGQVLMESGVSKVQCRFWFTGQPPRCSLEPALGGLAAINDIPGMLQSLASQGKE